MKNKKYAIFTDLDGTLLDHHTYSYEPALPALDALSRLEFPVIPVTSKTRLEVESLRKEIGLDTPFVTENGAAIFLPDATVRFLGLPHDELDEIREGLFCFSFGPSRQTLIELVEALQLEFPDCFTSFSQLGDQGIAQATGLDAKSAALANSRDYSEPLLWQGTDDELAAFIETLKERGYTALVGGRFLHITTGYDKGKALAWLMARYQAADQASQWLSVALGDSGNDIAMLEAADEAVLIRSPVKDFPEVDETHKVYRTQGCGPSGWTEAIELLVLNETTSKSK